MTEMSDMLKRENPLKVYNKHDELSGPSSRKQVHDKQYNDKRCRGCSGSKNIGAKKIANLDFLSPILQYWSQIMGKRNVLEKSTVYQINPVTFIEVPELSQEGSFICVLGISNLHISTIFLLNSGTVPTVCYIFFHFIIGYEKKPSWVAIVKTKYGCDRLRN